MKTNVISVISVRIRSVFIPKGNREPCGWSLGNWSGFRAGSGKTKTKNALRSGLCVAYLAAHLESGTLGLSVHMGLFPINYDFLQYLFEKAKVHIISLNF